MARPKSDEKRQAILATAIRVIAVQGLSAPTALIAKEAGVSNGSLFTYFATKSDLLNQLYVDLKSEMGTTAIVQDDVEQDARKEMAAMWKRWLGWALSNPDKRRALAHLSVSDEITPESQAMAHHAMLGVARLLERSREHGPMRDVPLPLVAAMLNAITDATVDYIIKNPTNADAHSSAAFDGVWRLIA